MIANTASQSYDKFLTQSASPGVRRVTSEYSVAAETPEAVAQCPALTSAHDFLGMIENRQASVRSTYRDMELVQVSVRPSELILTFTLLIRLSMS